MRYVFVRKPFSTDVLEILLQSYVSAAPSGTNFHRVENKLRFDQNIPARALHLVRHTNVLDNFWDFDNYLDDNNAPFLTNGAVGAALSARQ